jgi:hypothetical protein
MEINVGAVSGLTPFLFYFLPVTMFTSPTIIASWGSLANATAGAFTATSDNRTIKSFITSTASSGGVIGIATLTSFSAEL